MSLWVVAPVSAVVGVRGGQCVVLGGGHLGVKCFGRRTFRWKIILSEKEQNKVVIGISFRFTYQASFFHIKDNMSVKHKSSGKATAALVALALTFISSETMPEKCPSSQSPELQKGISNLSKTCVFQYN